MNPNQECKVCGQKYYACIDCDLKKNIEWTSVGCKQSHAELFTIVVRYIRGQLTKDQASNFINQLKFSKSEIDSFLPDIKRMVDEILQTDVVDSEVQEEVVVKTTTTRKPRAKKVESDVGVKADDSLSLDA